MTTKTKAFLKLDQKRDDMNPNASKIQAKNLSWTVYLSKSLSGKPCAVFYIGRSQKGARRFFNNNEYRDHYVKSWIESQQRINAMRDERKKARNLSLGDVLSGCYGYEQTNWEFYKVTKLIGKTMVEVVEIGKTHIEDDIGMQGKCAPNPNDIKSEPIRKKADGTSVAFEYFTATLHSYDEETFQKTGVKIYDPKNYSSYH